MATLNSQFCSAEEQSISAQTNAPLHCLTRNESIASAFVAQSAALSLFACVFTFALILRNIRYHARRRPGRWRLVNGPMDIYLLSLFFAETCLAIGGVINTKWVQDGKLSTGSWCTVQGLTLTLGNINIAFSTLTIAVHTFVMVWCNRGFDSTSAAWVVITIPWIYSIIYVAVLGSLFRQEPDNIFRPTPYWCWIGKQYLVYRLLGGYLWMWTSLFLSMLFYVPLFFWGRGNITIGDKFWNFKIHRRHIVEDAGGLRRHALGMIIYPAVYAFQIIPLSVARWIGFVEESHGNKKNTVPAAALLAVQFIYNLSGITNISLFLLTRRNLLLFNRDSDDTEPKGDVDSIVGHWKEEGNGHAHHNPDYR